MGEIDVDEGCIMNKINFPHHRGFLCAEILQQISLMKHKQEKLMTTNESHFEGT